MNTAPLRVITLKDGRMVKEMTGALTCKGCMFVFQSNDRMHCGRDEEDGDVLFGCRDRGTIYQPADPEPVAVAEPTESGRPAWCPGCRPDVCPGCGPYKYERAAAVAEPDPVVSALSSAARDRAFEVSAAHEEAKVRQALIALGWTPPGEVVKPVKREPVGHLWRDGETGQTVALMATDTFCESSGWGLVGPLFLGQPEPVTREPVEAGVVTAMFHASGGGFMPSLEHAYRRGFRDAERAHGIGGREGGAV